MKRTLFSRRGAVASLVGLSLLAGACSAGDSVPDNPAAQAANEAAAANIDGLAQSTNVFDIEVLDVADGSVATLREAVDGDRPVLLWFYAPH